MQHLVNVFPFLIYSVAQPRNKISVSSEHQSFAKIFAKVETDHVPPTLDLRAHVPSNFVLIGRVLRHGFVLHDQRARRIELVLASGFRVYSVLELCSYLSNNFGDARANLGTYFKLTRVTDKLTRQN